MCGYDDHDHSCRLAEPTKSGVGVERRGFKNRSIRVGECEELEIRGW